MNIYKEGVEGYIAEEIAHSHKMDIDRFAKKLTLIENPDGSYTLQYQVPRASTTHVRFETEGRVLTSRLYKAINSIRTLPWIDLELTPEELEALTNRILQSKN